MSYLHSPSPHKSSPAYSDKVSSPAQLNIVTSPPLVSRTPSPTPSEAQLLSHKGLNGPLNRKALETFFRPKNIPYILGSVTLIVVLILSIALHRKIANALRPAGETLRDLPGGWLIPVAVLVVISFPPLFGHEIVAAFVGIIWGIGVGFGIVALGTFLGELANFYVFRYFLRSRAARYEQENIKFGLLTHVIREGGFRMALIVRLSAIPSHFTTLVFSVSGMPSITYILAAILSLPRHGLGVVIGNMGSDDASAAKEEQSKIISGTTIGVTVLVTLGAMWYTNRKIEAAKPDFVRSRQKARQEDIAAEESLLNQEQFIPSLRANDPSVSSPSGHMATSSSYCRSPTTMHSYPPPNLKHSPDL